MAYDFQKAILDRALASRMPTPGERVKRSDELEAESRRLQSDREAFDDHRATQLVRMSGMCRRILLVDRVFDTWIDKVLPDYLRLLQDEQKSLERKGKAEAAENTARRARFVEISVELYSQLTEFMRPKQ
jgi:hypothetical protein